MKDSNSGLRAISVELASHLHDYKLIQEIERLFHEEKVWEVRKNVIKAIGSIKIRELASSLEELIGSDTSTLEREAPSRTSLGRNA